LINHSLLPLSCLPRKKSGGEDKETNHFSQGVETKDVIEVRGRAFFNTLSDANGEQIRLN
jgi:hypothetical protein